MNCLFTGVGFGKCVRHPFVLLRGLHTALVEKEDFASGTSSKSTKLVHGGVRYLEKAVFNLDYGQLKLVFEALHERKRLLQNAPHLSSALPIMTVLTLCESLHDTQHLISLFAHAVSTNKLMCHFVCIAAVLQVVGGAILLGRAQGI